MFRRIVLFFAVFFTFKAHPFTDDSLCKFSHTIYKNTHVRKGPGYHYPVFFTIKNTKNYPLKELVTYGDWVKVMDYENTMGWVYKNLITRKRESVIFLKPSYLYTKPKSSSKKIALIGRLNTAIFLKKKGKFIMVFINGLKGWTESSNCWPHK